MRSHQRSGWAVNLIEEGFLRLSVGAVVGDLIPGGQRGVWIVPIGAAGRAGLTLEVVVRVIWIRVLPVPGIDAPPADLDVTVGKANNERHDRFARIGTIVRGPVRTERHDLARQTSSLGKWVNAIPVDSVLP